VGVEACGDKDELRKDIRVLRTIIGGKTVYEEKSGKI
jgi:hypothetical protein